MNNSKNKIRIKDIAILAGVSEGTVDRVLHDRGDVSEKSCKAVNKILKEINYSPNLRHVRLHPRSNIVLFVFTQLLK